MHPTRPPMPGAAPHGVSTREIPVVPPQTSAAAEAAAQPQPTGPVDYVPGPPPTAPVPTQRPVGASAPSSDFLAGLIDEEPRRPRDARARARIAGGVLAALAVVLLELGLLVHVAGTTLWSRVPLWSGFATVAAVLGLAVAAPRLPGRVGGSPWAVAAGGLTGLAVFWLLVVLPAADTDRGFLLTAAVACLGGAVWVTASRSLAPERVLDRSGTVATSAADEQNG